MTAVNSRETPLMELSAVTQLPENTNSLACSEDGRYLCLGHSQGLSVWCTLSFTCVAQWLRDRLEITLVQITRMDEKTYLLGTVDDMGVARVLALYSNEIHLVSIINVMEDVNKRSICLTFDLHEGGRYGAASFSCNGAVWLEVLQFPIAAWLKELKTATSQNQHQNVSEEMPVKWSPVTVMNKIIPPEVPLGGSSLGVGRTSDLFMHFLALDAIVGSSHQRGADAGKTKETRGSSRGCTSHFLLPSGRFSADSKADFQPGLPVAVAVWWTGSHNLLHYSLQNIPKNKPDMAPTPDFLWPNAKEIVCSAVSRCNRYIGLGLEDALVCIWDRRTGVPLSVIALPAESSALLRMQLVDNRTASVHKSQVFTEPVQVSVLCKSGDIYMVTARQGAESCTVQLTGRPKDSSDLPAVIMSVPFLRAVMLVVQRNGKMFLQNVIDKTMLCFLTPPASHRISSPCSPVYALNPKQQVLYIRGDQEISRSAAFNTSSQIQLFVFRFEQSEIIKQYVVSSPHSPPQQPTLCLDTLEGIRNLNLQQRVLSVDERKNAVEQTWGRLQETAASI